MKIDNLQPRRLGFKVSLSALLLTPLSLRSAKEVENSSLKTESAETSWDVCCHEGDYDVRNADTSHL